MIPLSKRSNRVAQIEADITNYAHDEYALEYFSQYFLRKKCQIFVQRKGLLTHSLDSSLILYFSTPTRICPTCCRNDKRGCTAAHLPGLVSHI